MKLSLQLTEDQKLECFLELIFDFLVVPDNWVGVRAIRKLEFRPVIDLELKNNQIMTTLCYLDDDKERVEKTFQLSDNFNQKFLDKLKQANRSRQINNVEYSLDNKTIPE